MGYQLPPQLWLCLNTISAHIYICITEIVLCTLNLVDTHKVHPYGGGRRCLNFCANVLNEGIFILVVDNDLGS